MPIDIKYQEEAKAAIKKAIGKSYSPEAIGTPRGKRDMTHMTGFSANEENSAIEIAARNILEKAKVTSGNSNADYVVTYQDRAAGYGGGGGVESVSLYWNDALNTQLESQLIGQGQDRKSGTK